jgi:hypothetical protein
MKSTSVLRASVAAAFIAGGVLVSAQTTQLPSGPAKGFGGSVSPAYEGWFDNPDGTHSFLIGYYNRNTREELDIPIGPNNKFEGATPDMGQPEHFRTRRHYGMFVVTVPKEFPKTQKITWTLTANGVTTSVPFHMHTDYNITPWKSSEESPNRLFNEPPKLRFTEAGPTLVGPFATMASASARTATVNTPMPISVFVDDDALYSSGGNGPMNAERSPVSVSVTKYRGPGEVKVDPASARMQTTKGGKPLEDYSGKATPTVTFSEAGDYVLHVQINDYSGPGGGGSGCCWTTTLVKVAVK